MTTAATFASRSGSIEAPAPGKYWANMPPSEVPLEQWMKQFERDGFLFVKSVLPPETTAVLREQLDRYFRFEDSAGDTAAMRAEKAALTCQCQQHPDAKSARTHAYLESVEKRFTGVNRCC